MFDDLYILVHVFVLIDGRKFLPNVINVFVTVHGECSEGIRIFPCDPRPGGSCVP